MLTLLLTRHGHTVRSEPEQYLGQRIDAPLSERGRREAEGLSARLDGVAIDRIVTSPLARAAGTAAILAVGRGLEVESDERLKELDYGAWEGLTVDQIERRFPGEMAAYDADPARHRVGGAENGEMVAQRLAGMLAELIEWGTGGSAERTCLLVGHSSTNRILLASVLGVPLADYRRRFQSDWASLSVLRWTDPRSGPLLLVANDVGHLRGLAGATWD